MSNLIAGSNSGTLDGLDSTAFAILAGQAGGQTLNGGTAANEDLTLQGTSSGTKTTSLILLQPTGGGVVVGGNTGTTALHVVGVLQITGSLGLGTSSPATLLALVANEALTGNTTDDYSAGLTLAPAYLGDGIVTTVALNAAGIDYHNNDVLTVVQAGGVGCTVTATVAAGDTRDHVETVTLTTAGLNYTVAVRATTGGTGTGCTISVDSVDGGDGHIDTLSVSAGGQDYTVGDVLTLAAPGTGGTVTVATIDGDGHITSIVLTSGGTGYAVANGLTTTVATGFGTGATIDVTVLTARTVSRHNYVDVNNPTYTKGAAVTNAYLFRFDAALGTHLATSAADKTGNAKSGTIMVNVDGTPYHIQLYADS